MSTVHIAQRFNGPPESANGGYAAGCVAEGRGGVTTVRLHVPPPLDVDMELRDEGDRRVLWHGEAKVASAWSGTLVDEVPPAPSMAEAEVGTGAYAARHVHAFPSCFVCGPARAEQDGLRIFAGPVPEQTVVAAPWRPPGQGAVPEPIVWAALDCPSFFGLRVDFSHAFLLGEMTAQITAPLDAAESYVVYGWKRGQSGRKHLAGAAIADGAGRVLARAEHVWFDMKGRM